MKILILAPISLPPLETISMHIDASELLFRSKFHNHPWVNNLAVGLSKIDSTKIHVLMLSNLVSKKYVFESQGINYHILPSYHRYINALTWFYLEVKKIKSYIASIKPDIIHSQDRAYLSYAALQTRLPVVVTNHGQIDEHFKALGHKSLKYYIFSHFLRKVNQKMQFCIGVSPNCTTDCTRFLPSVNIFLIENAIHPVFFEKQTIDDNNTILFVGSLTELKQVKELVNAVAQVPDCQLKIIHHSSNMQYYSELLELIESLKIKHRIQFVGQKNQIELAQEIASCTALCLPSKYESFGMVLAEAMAVGKPVIASEIEGPSFIVTHQQNGLLFPVGQVDRLANCISQLTNNKSLCKTLGQSAQNEAYKRFSPHAVASKTYAVYKKVLSL